MDSSSEAADFLAIIIDLNPISWATDETDETDNLSLETALENVLVFCNSHLALKHENGLGVWAAGRKKSQLLHSTSLASSATEVSKNSNSSIYRQFRVLDESIVEKVKEMLTTGEDLNEESFNSAMEKGESLHEIDLVGAFSKCLCHINRLQQNSQASAAVTTLKYRILVISNSPDQSKDYVSMMGCIFLAQKQGIPVDCLKVSSEDSVFLQQASYLTNGIYYRLENKRGILQYLLMCHLPSTQLRKHLNLPRQEEVDLRAACFCHQKIVEIGYVCSVCLSIFCSPIPVCATCRTKFPISTLRKFGFGASKTNSRSSPGSGTSTPSGAKKRKRPMTNGTAPSTPVGSDRE